jgi:APA family basic amino acid/polyamine antiporter
LTTRSIGFWTAVALVMGNMIGSGVFLLPASLAPFGGLAFGGWMISAGGAVALALVFARLARENPAAGGIYAYSRAAFGDLAGFLVGWGYWNSVWAGCAALAIALVGYLDPFVPSVVRSPPLAAAAAIVAVWLLTFVNLSGVAPAGRVQVVTTALKILPLLIIGVAGLAVLNPSHFAIPDGGIDGAGAGALGTVGTLMAAATLTMWALLGLESATIPADSIEAPDRNIPKATVVGTVLTAAIYIISTAGVMGVLSPDALAHTTAPFADAARRFFGDWGAWIVAAGGVISCFGALNGWILVQGQLPRPVAADGLFPKVFGRLSARGTPVFALVLGSVLSSVLIAANSSRGLVALFTFVIQLSTLSTLIPYVFCSLAGFMRGQRSVAGVVAFLFSMFAIAGAGAEVVFYGFLLLLAGLPIFVWVRRQQVTA